jgi:hypothetical protein
MERTTRFALALVTPLLVAGCGGRVAPTNTDDQGGDSTGTTPGGPTSKQSGNAGQGQQGSDSSGGALGGGSGDSSSGGSSTQTGSNGASSSGGGGPGSGSCSVVLSNVFGNFTDTTFDGAHGGGVSEGVPWQVGCEFSDASYDYSFSATFLGGATTGHVVTMDARLTRASRTCSADCPYDDAQLAKCDFSVSVATDQAFVASFQCSMPSGEDLPPAGVNGSMNVTLVPDTLK